MPEKPPSRAASALRSASPLTVRSPYWASLPEQQYAIETLPPPEPRLDQPEPEHQASLLQRLGAAIGLAVLSFGAAGGIAVPAAGATTAIVQTMDTESRTDALIRGTSAHDGDTQGNAFFHAMLHRATEEAQRWAIDECCTALGTALWWAIRHRKQLPEMTLRTLERLEDFLGGSDRPEVVKVLHDADASAEEMHRRGCTAFGVMVLDRARHLVRGLLCGDHSLASAEGEALSSAIVERLTANLSFGQGGTELARAMIECIARSIAKEGLRGYCAG